MEEYHVPFYQVQTNPRYNSTLNQARKVRKTIHAFGLSVPELVVKPVGFIGGSIAELKEKHVGPEFADTPLNLYFGGMNVGLLLAGVERYRPNAVVVAKELYAALTNERDFGDHLLTIPAVAKVIEAALDEILW